VQACRKLKQLINEHNYILIHGNTPVGGLVSRIASIEARRKGAKVLYTAHGFHFYKGAPIFNWMFFYPVEKLLSSFTDGLITINREDYELLFRRKFKCDKYLINGVGVNNDRFHPVLESEKVKMRKDLGYLENQLILIYLAEFIPRKNHQFIIQSVPEILMRIPDLKIIFAGRGILLDRMRDYAQQLDVLSHIDFMGFRDDIDKLLAISDIGISTSRQEGLGINIAEAMFVGLPIVATDERGHREMVKHGENGFLFEQNNSEQFINFICSLASNKGLRNSFGKRSIELVDKFSLSNAIEAMSRIYANYVS
jgi:glycosyltransferase EpsD